MNHLKAISKTDSELRVGNYMVLFGGKDLVGEFFTKDTVFKSGYTDLGMLYVDFEHGMDPDRIGNDQDCVLGVVDWKSAKVDDTGIYVERILARQAQYMEFIEELIDAGVMGTSSQAIYGKTTKKSGGEIIEWPLMRDSLTVTPMEPRMLGENALRAAKSLHAVFPNAKSLARACGVELPDPDYPKTVEEIIDFKSACSYLRNARGCSRTEATAIVARLKSLTLRNAEEDEQVKALERLRCGFLSAAK